MHGFDAFGTLLAGAVLVGASSFCGVLSVYHTEMN